MAEGKQKSLPRQRAEETNRALVDGPRERFGQTLLIPSSPTIAPNAILNASEHTSNSLSLAGFVAPVTATATMISSAVAMTTVTSRRTNLNLASKSTRQLRPSARGGGTSDLNNLNLR
jgi:hypothetical protein